MKKFLQMAFVSVLAFSFMANVYAGLDYDPATEQDLIDFATKTYKIAGKNVKADDEFIVTLKQYLNDNEVSKEDAGTVLGCAKEIKDILTEAGTTNPNKLSKTDKNFAIAAARRGADALDMTVSYDAKNQALIVYKDGKKYTTIYLVEDNDGNVTVSTIKGKTPARTGRNYTVYAGLSGLALIVVAGTTAYRKLKEDE